MPPNEGMSSYFVSGRSGLLLDRKWSPGIGLPGRFLRLFPLEPTNGTNGMQSRRAYHTSALDRRQLAQPLA
jgi:hypothetical protein